ncbi:MAG TPA: class II glutamine amidotransferase, partial [Bacteroidota bacterium]|nr:class II glutamine amidotransferase [Bacteroidota bacterium]
MDVKEFKEIDKPHSNCGVYGIYNHPQASLMTYYGLFSMQHRGQESAGITTFYFDNEKKKMRYAYHKGIGLVSEVFADSKIFQDELIGNCAIGHNRYSTTGSMTRWNVQPFNINYKSGILSLAHNGNLTNTKYLRKKLQDEGTIFQTTSDSELFLHLMAHSKKTTPLEQLQDALQQTIGAYSLVLLTESSLIGVRDPYGVRPLSIGRVKNNGSWAYILASETCAFDIIDAEYIRSVENNEIVVIDDDTIKTGEIKSYKILPETPTAKHCIFEYIYFARPDSKIFGESVDRVRRKLGKELAIESPVVKSDGERVDVIGVPDSANTASLGFAHSNNKYYYPT